MNDFLHITRPPKTDELILVFNEDLSDNVRTQAFFSARVGPAKDWAANAEIKWGFLDGKQYPANWFLTMDVGDDAPYCWIYVKDLPLLLSALRNPFVVASPETEKLRAENNRLRATIDNICTVAQAAVR